MIFALLNISVGTEVKGTKSLMGRKLKGILRKTNNNFIIRIVRFLLDLLLLDLVVGCAPFDQIYSHEFSSGYFKLKGSDGNSGRVYLDKKGDSITLYPVLYKGKSIVPDTSVQDCFQTSYLKPGSHIYNNTFIKTSVDMDLSTALLKFRIQTADVPSQLSANLNGLIYTGFRKDFYKLKTHTSPLSESDSFIRHTGFDFGLFAGIGITPVNPTVTGGKIIQEYDGVVFQKGIAGFMTFENMSVGISLGFDNLVDRNSNIWIYNQRPWIGMILGIANF